MSTQNKELLHAWHDIMVWCSDVVTFAMNPCLHNSFISNTLQVVLSDKACLLGKGFEDW